MEIEVYREIWAIYTKQAYILMSLFRMVILPLQVPICRKATMFLQMPQFVALISIAQF